MNEEKIKEDKKAEETLKEQKRLSNRPILNDQAQKDIVEDAKGWMQNALNTLDENDYNYKMPEKLLLIRNRVIRTIEILKEI